MVELAKVEESFGCDFASGGDVSGMCIVGLEGPDMLDWHQATVYTEAASKALSAAISAMVAQAFGPSMTTPAHAGCQEYGPFRALTDAEVAEFEITSGQATQPAHPTSNTTPKGLTRIAQDGERLGRLAWNPGA